MEALPEQEQQTLSLRIHNNIAKDNSSQWNGNTFTGNTFNITNNQQSAQQAQGSDGARDSKPRIHPPRRPNSSFIGQEDVLKHMRDSLLPSSEHDHEPATLVLHGIGGVGKSEIVLQFVERHKSSYWGLFWIDFGSEDKARNTYPLIAKRCGWSVLEGEDPVSEVVNRLGETDEPWLLILDNCDKSDIDYSNFIPSGVSGSSIITTRLPEVAEVCGENNKFEISGLDEQSAVTLLLKGGRVSMPSPAQSFCAAMNIAKQLDCHSLAVTVAASMLRKGRYGLEEYSEALKRPKTQAELFQTKLKQDMPRYGTAFATFEISVEALLETDPESGGHAVELLSILGFLDRTGVPEDLFTRAWAWGHKYRYNSGYVNLEESDHSSYSESASVDSSNAEEVETEEQIDGNAETTESFKEDIEKLWPSHFADALDFAWSVEDDLFKLRKAREMLSELSLIFLSSDSQVIIMHPLLHSWARQRLSRHQALSAWAFTEATLCLSSEKRFGWRNFTPLLRPHFESCFDLWPDKDADQVPTLEVCSTLYQFWWQLYRADSRYCMSLVEQLERRFPANSTTRFGRVDENHIKILQMRAHTLDELGDHRSSLEIDKQIVVAYQETRSEDDIDLLRAQASLALSFLKLGQTQQALEILHEIVRIGKESFPSDDISLLSWQHSLGQTLTEERQFEEAVAVLEDVVRIKGQMLPSTSPGRLSSQHELGRAYLRDGRSQKAVEILEEVVRIQSDILSPSDQGRLTSQHVLGGAYLGNGQFQKAVEMLEEVVRLRSETLPPTNQDRLTSQHGLGRAYLGNGQFQEAIEILEEVVRIRSDILSPSDSKLLASQYELGRAYLGIGQSQEAIEILDGVVGIRSAILSPSDRKLLATQSCLARAYLRNDQIEEAIALREHIVEMEKTLSPKDRYTSEYNLLNAYLKGKQLRKARAFCDHIMVVADHLSAENQEDLQELEDRLVALEREQEGERTDALEQETNNDSSDQ